MIYANYIRILLNEANAENCSALDLKGLEELMQICIEGNTLALHDMCSDRRPRVKSAARFIQQKHNFEVASRLHGGINVRPQMGSAAISRQQLG